MLCLFPAQIAEKQGQQDRYQACNTVTYVFRPNFQKLYLISS